MMRAYTRYPLFSTVVYTIEKHVHYNLNYRQLVNPKNLKDVTCFIRLSRNLMIQSFML